MELFQGPQRVCLFIEFPGSVWPAARRWPTAGSRPAGFAALSGTVMGISRVTTETVLVPLADAGFSWHTVPFHHIHLDFFTHAATQRWKWELKQTHTHTHSGSPQGVCKVLEDPTGAYCTFLHLVRYYCDAFLNPILQKPAKKTFIQRHIDYAHVCISLRLRRGPSRRAASCLFDFCGACSQPSRVRAPFQVHVCHLVATTSHDN